MDAVFEAPGKGVVVGKSTPRIIMMPPKELAPSPFGTDVNPQATPEEELSLRESVAKDGVLIPLTAGRAGSKGGYAVVKGTRRHAVALALDLKEIPVELKEYESIEDMRQDALRDNLERRQLSPAGRAELANALWRSFDIAEDKREMAAQGLSPRKRASIAGGLSEGTLASYRYVLDSNNTDLIDKMKAGGLSISKAASEAKRLTEGESGAAKTTSSTAAVDQVKILRDSFGNLVRAAGSLREAIKHGKSVVKLAKKGQVNDLAILIKQVQAVNQSIAALTSSGRLTEQYDSTLTTADPHASAGTAIEVDMKTFLADQQEKKHA